MPVKFYMGTTAEYGNGHPPNLPVIRTLSPLSSTQDTRQTSTTASTTLLLVILLPCIVSSPELAFEPDADESVAWWIVCYLPQYRRAQVVPKLLSSKLSVLVHWRTRRIRRVRL